MGANLIFGPSDARNSPFSNWKAGSRQIIHIPCMSTHVRHSQLHIPTFLTMSAQDNQEILEGNRADFAANVLAAFGIGQ